MWTAEQSEVAAPMGAKGLETVLTERERRIVALVGKGYTNHQIAEALQLNHQTVKNKLTVIFNKVGIRGRLKLAVFAMEHDIQ